MDSLAREFQRLNFNVNRTQFRAQLYEEECVDLVRDLMYSNDVTPAQRLMCAQQIVQWARGEVESWRHDGETIDTEAPALAGGTVGAVIEAASRTADLYRTLDHYVRNRIPFADWPAEVRNLAEAAAFADLDDDGSAVIVGIAGPEDQS